MNITSEMYDMELYFKKFNRVKKQNKLNEQIKKSEKQNGNANT